MIPLNVRGKSGLPVIAERKTYGHGFTETGVAKTRRGNGQENWAH